MSVTSYRGGRIVRQKRNRLRRPEQAEERARRLFLAFCDGHETRDLAALFGITERHVRRVLAAVPPRLRRELQAEARETRRARLDALAERIDDAARRVG